MTDKLNLTFTNEEHDLYLWLKDQPNASGLIKDLLKGYRNGGTRPSADPASEEPAEAVIKSLVATFIGDDVREYGGERAFLDYVDEQMLSNRVARLMQAHPVEAVYVLAAAKKTYPAIGAKL